MATGNIIGYRNKPTISSASGIWNLRESQIATQAGTWPGITAPDSLSSSNILTMKAAGASNATNTAFLDSSANGFTVTRNGDVTQGTFSPYFPAGYWSAYFDGSGDYLSATAGTPLNLGTGDFTVEAWVNFNTQAGTIISTYGGWWLQYRSDYNGFCFGVGDTFTLVRAWTWKANQWIHVAVTRSGTSLRMFFDGVQQGATLTDSTNFSIGSTLYCGALFNNFNHLNGYISNLRVVKGTAVYTANFTPSTSPLTAVSGTSLLCLQDSRFLDRSSNALAISRSGDTTVARQSPFAPPRLGGASTYGGSGYFDGGGDVLTIPDSTALNMGTGDFTWDLWFYPIAGSAYQGLMTKGASYTGTSTGLWIAPGNNLHWSGTQWIGTSGAVRLAQWNHAAVTRSSGTVKVWLNGSQEASFADATDYTTSGAAFSIGDRTPGHSYGQYPFTGYISNARVVKGSAVYTAAFTPPTTPVIAISGTGLLLNFDNAGIYDSVGRSNLRTLGTAKVSTSTTKWSTGSIALDGTANCCVKAIPGPDQPYSFGTRDFTIEMWFRLTSMGTYPALFDWRPYSTSTPSPCIMVGYGGASKLTYYMGTATAITGTTNITTGTWYHAAVCRASGVTRLFLNGVQEGSNYADTNNYTGPNPTFGALGYDPSLTSYTLNGFLEDIRVTRSARYTSAFTLPPAPFA